MRKLSNSEMKAYFLGWQCRIRQLSARAYGGAPLPAMRPRVLTKSGEELMSAMTVLIVPKAPEASTTYLKFQVQKTHEASKVYEAGVKFLAESYFQEPLQGLGLRSLCRFGLGALRRLSLGALDWLGLHALHRFGSGAFSRLRFRLSLAKSFGLDKLRCLSLGQGHFELAFFRIADLRGQQQRARPRIIVSRLQLDHFLLLLGSQ